MALQISRFIHFMILLSTFVILVIPATCYADPSTFNFANFDPCTQIVNPDPPLRPELYPNNFSHNPQTPLHLIVINKTTAEKHISTYSAVVTSCSAKFSYDSTPGVDGMTISKYSVNNLPLAALTIESELQHQQVLADKKIIEINGVVAASFTSTANMLNVNEINVSYYIILPGAVFALQSEENITQARKLAFMNYVEDCIGSL